MLTNQRFKQDTPQGPHIYTYTENTEGHDYIIGDIHGSASAFAAVLAQLGEHDHLFIVGDLFDRGEDSYEIFTLIQKYNKNNPGKIHVTRGNHDEDFLKVMNALREKELNQLSSEEMATLLCFITNGGEWIFSKGRKNKINHDKLSKVFDSACLLPSAARKNALREILFHVFTADDSIPLLNPAFDLEGIYQYVQSSPYIIRVGDRNDENPFTVCHADLEFTDEELEERVNSKKPELDPKEIQYITWARPDQIAKKSKRNASSTRVYCGHNIVSPARREPSVRDNTINLDFVAYLAKQFILLNHSEHTVKIVEGNFTSEKTIQQLYQQSYNAEQVSIINAHLQKYKPRDLVSNKEKKRISDLIFSSLTENEELAPEALTEHSARKELICEQAIENTVSHFAVPSLSEDKAEKKRKKMHFFASREYNRITCHLALPDNALRMIQRLEQYQATARLKPYVYQDFIDRLMKVKAESEVAGVYQRLLDTKKFNTHEIGQLYLASLTNKKLLTDANAYCEKYSAPSLPRSECKFNLAMRNKYCHEIEGRLMRTAIAPGQKPKIEDKLGKMTADPPGRMYQHAITEIAKDFGEQSDNMRKLLATKGEGEEKKKVLTDILEKSRAFANEDKGGYEGIKNMRDNFLQLEKSMSRLNRNGELKILQQNRDPVSCGFHAFLVGLFCVAIVGLPATAYAMYHSYQHRGTIFFTHAPNSSYIEPAVTKTLKQLRR